MLSTRCAAALVAASLVLGPTSGVAGVTAFTYDPTGNLLSVSDVSTDLNNCGSRGTVCQGDDHGSPECVNGRCVLNCVTGYAFNSSTHVCVDLASDPNNCGGLYTYCKAPTHGVATCSSGVCGMLCDPGFTLANGTCLDLKLDPNNCGQVANACPAVPGYVECCSAAVCGAFDGTRCVDIASDSGNCGWVGHSCPAFGTQAPACSNGRCVMPAGTPAVTALNGASPRTQVFRTPFWSGVTLTGTKLDYVTSVELEDWGPDTVDGLPDGIRSVPRFQGLVLPLDSGGPTLHYAQSATVLTVDGASLQFQLAYDARLGARRWYKVRLHYTSKQTDRSFTVDVPFSLADPVAVTLPAPQITGVSAFYRWVNAETAFNAPSYDPATGLLATSFDPTQLARLPVSVLTVDFEEEVPVLRARPEGLYLPPGLVPAAIDQTGGENGGEHTSYVVFSYDHAGEPFNIAQARIIVRGSSLWDDGNLHLANPLGTAVPGDLYSFAEFHGDKIIIPQFYGATEPSAFIEFDSMRGTASTPWPVDWVSPPVITRAECGAYACPTYLSINLPITLNGTWFRYVDEAYLVGDSANESYHVTEYLFKVDAEPGPNQFHVVDNQHVTIVLAAAGGSGPDVVARGAVSWADCDGTIWWTEYLPTAYRWLCVNDSQHALAACVTLTANPSAPISVVQEPRYGQACPSDPPEDGGGGGGGLPPDGGGGPDCTNTICLF